MISVRIFRNANGEVYSFSVRNHGSSIVCAAVSALVFNTINSIEAFTNEHILVKSKEDGGFIDCVLPAVQEGAHSHDANLLLNALVLGLNSIQEEHKKDIHIKEV